MERMVIGRRARNQFLWAAMLLSAGAGCGQDSGGSPQGQADSNANAAAEAASLTRDLTVGSTGADARFVNDFLTTYGYLPNAKLQDTYPRWRSPVQTSPAHPDVYDDATAAGVRAFQLNYGLPQTGIADQATRDLLSVPRCGVPDNVQRLDPTDKFQAFPPVGWGTTTNLRVKVTNNPSNLTLAQTRAAVMAGANQWVGTSFFTFTQVTSGTAEIVINFAPQNQWCAGGNIGGFAAATGPAGGPGGSACITFDSAPNDRGTALTWTVSSPTGSTSLDLQSTAAHEIGHTIGMGHSGYTTALMCGGREARGVQQRTLTPDDVAGAYALGVIWTNFDTYGENDVDIDDGAMFYTRYVTAAPTLPSGELTVWSYTNGGPWVNMSGSASDAIGGMRISSDTVGTWIVQSDGDIYSFNGGTSWTKRPGCAKDIAVGPDGSIWVLGCAQDGNGNFPAYRWNGSGWTHDATGGAAVRISVGKRLDSNRTVPWVVAADGSIYRRSRNDTSSAEQWNVMPGAGRDIAANASGYTWLLGTGAAPGGFGIFVWDEQPACPSTTVGCGSGAPQKMEWDQIPGGAINIASSSFGSPTVVNDGGSLLER
jgi:peptidoglycan hydrolase-like protein with peptidoglycan-binding domain